MHLLQLLKEAVQQQASDLHLKVDAPPILRINKELVKLSHLPLTISDLEFFIAELLPPAKIAIFKEHHEMDFAYTVPDIGRFRVDVFYQRGLPGIVLRRVKKEFQDFASLGLPEVLKKICQFNQGLVVVCGQARSGKSTTIATMLNHINETRKLHIISIEDPIEFLFEDNMSIIDQREVGIDTDSFGTALKYLMREDPDLIFLGELRDTESFQSALKAAETGHLVFTTLHAGNARDAVGRMLDYFPIDQRSLIQIQLSHNLAAIIALKLLPKKDNHGMVPAVEVMLTTGLIEKLIKENNLMKLSAAIELGRHEGMQTFNQSLVSLVQDGHITEEEALAHSPNPEVLRLNLQGIFLDDANKILEG